MRNARNSSMRQSQRRPGQNGKNPAGRTQSVEPPPPPPPENNSPFAALLASFVLNIFQLFHFHTGEPILITPEANNGKRENLTTPNMDETEGFRCLGHSNWLSYWRALHYPNPKRRMLQQLTVKFLGRVSSLTALNTDVRRSVLPIPQIVSQKQHRRCPNGEWRREGPFERSPSFSCCESPPALRSAEGG